MALRISNQISSRGQQVLAREGKVRPLPLLLCVLLPLLWEGLPFVAVGLPRAGGFYATTALIVIGLILFMVKRIDLSLRLNLFTISSGLLAIVFLVSSVISGALFFRNPIGDWAPELVYYSPCLLIFLIMALGIRISEIAWGIAISASISAILVIIDSFSHLTIMNSYLATSGFDFHARRILLLKNEIGCAACIAFAWAITTRSIRLFLVSIVIFCLTFYDLVQFIETRLVIAAVLAAIACFALFVPNFQRKFVFGVVCILLGLTVAPILFQKYIDQLSRMSSLAEDGSVAWRLETVTHYQSYFDQTSGLGFGLMSVKQFSNNILSYSIYDAATLHGIQRGAWGFYLADTSFYGALFQFGYLGLLLTVLMTGATAFSLLKYGFTKGLPYREAMAAMGFFVLFLLISPWPTNLFTLSWSMLSGNMLLSCAARAAYLRHLQTRGAPRRTNTLKMRAAEPVAATE